MKIDTLIKIASKKGLFILFLTALMYILGSGIANYLGADFRSFDFWLGLIWIISIHIAGYLLELNFSSQKNSFIVEDYTENIGRSRISLLVSMIFIPVTAVFITILLVQNTLSIIIGALLTITIVGLILMMVPPFNLSSRGYQEIGLAFFQGCLAPALGFFLLKNDFHRMLFLIVFPLTMLSIAFYIALNFSSYAHDQKMNRNSLVNKISWQSATPIHHLMLLSPYLFLFLGVSRGLPVEIFQIALLTLPLAVFQIIWLQRITRGAKPIWLLYEVIAGSVYGLSAYLIGLTLWTH